MSNPSAAPGSQPVQIPERTHAVGPGWRQLLEHLHEQVHAIAPDYRLVDLTEKLGGLRLHVEDPAGDSRTHRCRRGGVGACLRVLRCTGPRPHPQ
ncbi:hypothetical protein G3I78_35105 [Streptomyces sp. SID13726]|nr:hypothetical protein [Streptomyces sp. SID13726]